MSALRVALCGNPNVGKSTFFNKLTGQRLSIVDDTPGVTRDRISAEVEWNGCVLTVIDTGGIEPDAGTPLLKQMRMQALVAIESADVIVFLADLHTGVTDADREIATMLRKSAKPVILAVNKVDTVGDLPPEFYDFYSLGFGDPVAVSSIHGTGCGDVLDLAVSLVPERDDEERGEGVIRVAVIGKPNAGKSSLLNALLGYDRAIVTSKPGTTRDTIEEKLLLGDTLLRLTDTAGLRQSPDEAEQEGIRRALCAAREAELAIAVFDGSKALNEEDIEAINAAKAAKNSICVINKTDLPQVIEREVLEASFKDILTVSALTGEGLKALEQAVARLFPNPEAPAGELLTNARQAEAVRRALGSLDAAQEALAQGYTADAVLTEAEAALDALAELTGRSVKQDITDRIFSRFCVGK